MKLKGFTLAEVLIVLGIIGVISALTMPTFTASTSNAQIGPKLGKAVASFEEAAHTYIANESNNVSCLGEIQTTGTQTKEFAILNALRTNLNYDPINDQQVSKTDPAFITKDGIIYMWTAYTYNPKSPLGAFEGSTLPKDTRIGMIEIFINGAGALNDSGSTVDKSSKKSAQAKVAFRFFLYDDGSLLPFGSIGYDKAAEDGGASNHWKTMCPNRPDKIPSEGRWYCAGSIFEQGMKVNYKID